MLFVRGQESEMTKQKINQFASQMFTINVISTICSYACLIFFLVIWPQNHNLVLLLLVQSSQIIATTLGMDWVNNVYEDFFYITIRYIIFQCLALVGMFIFVHGLMIILHMRFV